MESEEHALFRSRRELFQIDVHQVIVIVPKAEVVCGASMRGSTLVIAVCGGAVRTRSFHPSESDKA